MPIVAAIVSLIPAAVAVEGGIEQLINLVAKLQAGGSLSADEVDQIRAEGDLEDAAFNAEMEAAKKRLGLA